MAKISAVVGNPILNKISETGKKIIASSATKLANGNCVKSMVGTESRYDEERNQTGATLRTSIAQELAKSLSIGTENFTDAQLEAASMVVMASGDPQSYCSKAMAAADFSGLENYQSEAPMQPVLDYDMEPIIGTEYFNQTKLDTHLAASFTFNLIASRQDDFCESFFPTIVADPSECGMLVEIKKTMVYRAVRHTIDKEDQRNFNFRNILDAATDHTVLEDESTRFVPYRKEDGTNADEFIPEAIYAPVNRDVGDYSVPTAPLAFTGEERDLLSLSAHPGLVSSGVLDESDEFDGRVSLENLYFKVNTASGREDQAQLIKFNTDNITFATFQKAQEGDGRDMTLNFRNAHFGASKATKDLKNAKIVAFNGLEAAGYVAQFTVNMNSNLNLQTGIELMNGSKVRWVSLRDAEGNSIDMSKGQGKNLIDAIKIECVGYEYKMTRSNSNRRTKGLLIDNLSTQERYKITLGSPLTSRKPTTGNVDDSQRLNDLIVAARMRNNNLAITKLLSYTETLKDIFNGRTDEYEIPTIEGVGRHYVGAWYGEYTFDAIKQVGTLESKDVADNLANALLSSIRVQCVTAYRDARFQPALEMLSGYTISKPEVLIGTDPYTANWLYTKGDVRTLGDMFNYKVVTTNDKRFRNRIQWVFKVGSENGGFTPLHFGNHLWVPELISNTNLSRNDATANEITVQPRNYHIVNTPITGVVFPLGLAHYVNNKPVVDINPRTDENSPLYIKGLDATGNQKKD